MGAGMMVSTSIMSANTASHIRTPETCGRSATWGCRKLLNWRRMAHINHPVHRKYAMGRSTRMVRREMILCTRGAIAKMMCPPSS